MDRVSWISGEGSLTASVDGYWRYLEQRGYSPRAVRDRMELVSQLNVWLVSQWLSAAELTEAQAQRFLDARRDAGQRRVPTLRMLAPLLDYLRDVRVVPPEQPPVSRLDDLLVRYRRHLARDRGLAPLTVVRYQRMAKRFLTRRAALSGGESGAAGLDGAEVHVYLLECCSRLVIESVKREAAELRSMLRFLHAEGLTATDLGSAIPPLAGWRNTRLPATMSTAQVTALLNSCDRSRPGGLRDLAILSLLGRLGLRSGEVSALRLADIDWRAGEILVRGKGLRDARLPLTVEVGEAIAAYLRHGRPSSGCPNVILTCYAPFRGIPSQLNHARGLSRLPAGWVGPGRRASSSSCVGHRDATLAWASWTTLLMGTLLGWLFAAITHLALRTIGRSAPDRPIPLGPFLIIGAVAALLIDGSL